MGRLQRWALQLKAHQFQVVYRPSSEHGNADALSRLPLPESDGMEFDEVYHLACESAAALPVSKEMVAEATLQDSLLQKVLRFVKLGWPATSSQLSTYLKPFFMKRHELSPHEGYFLWNLRVVIPQRLRLCCLRQLHESHMGAARMKSTARQYLWWPNVDREIENVAKECASCHESRAMPAKEKSVNWNPPSGPWQRIHIDFAGPFFNRMWFLAIDAWSKWPEVIEMKSTTTANTIQVLRSLFSRNGIPVTLVSDNGPQFTSFEFEEFCRFNAVNHVLTPPYHPSSNGEVERFVQTFKNAIRSANRSSSSTLKDVNRFLLSYRSTLHPTTKSTPAARFIGRELRTRFDLLKETQQHPTIATSQPKRHFTRNDIVWAWNYRGGTKWVKGTVITLYDIRLENRQVWRRHIDQLRPAKVIVRNGIDTCDFTFASCQFREPFPVGQRNEVRQRDLTGVLETPALPLRARRVTQRPRRYDAAAGEFYRIDLKKYKGGLL